MEEFHYIGGKAPTIAPIQVFPIQTLFNGVYTQVYRTTLAAPSAAVMGLTNTAKIPVPMTAEETPNENACSGLIPLRTNALFLVRAIWASTLN